MPPLIPTPARPLFVPTDRFDRITSDFLRQEIDLDSRQVELLRLLTGATDTTIDSDINGVYVHGLPGRGKSMILDAFCDGLETDSTARFHFHDFFRAINSPKQFLEGKKIGSIFAEGLERELAGKRIVLFDEFHCAEPGDAMFMAKLVAYCHSRDIFLVTTSNYAPEKLLDDDTFHHLIMPTINLIRENFTVFELDTAVDYRTLATPATLRQSGYRAGTLNVQAMPEFLPEFDTKIQVGYGDFGPASVNEQTVYVTFEQLCRTRRNTADYLDLAGRYSRWHIVEVPPSDQMPMDEERRFANLIDVFYDRNIEVHLYTQDRLQHLGRMLHDTERARLASRIAQLLHIQNNSDRTTR